MKSSFALRAALLVLVSGTTLAWTARAAEPANPAVVRSEFIVPTPPFASSHASTIVETPDGLVAAWFGGTEEGAPDVSIWLARHDGTGWSAPEEVANGIDVKAHKRYPCWNPVLHLRPNGKLYLFYKVGPNPTKWWGMVRLSEDYGRSWVKVRRLPTGYVGPVRNKPVELLGGTLLCGASLEDRGWRVHFETTDDPFGLWWKKGAINAAYTMSVIQPTILQWGDWRFQVLCRSKQGWVMETWSTNNAASWTPLTRTPIPNPNSALDGVVLRQGPGLIVYNHGTEGRSTLNLALSSSGTLWQSAGLLESEAGAEFSYPAVIQGKDNLVHVTYTWKRQRIKHVVLDADKLKAEGAPFVLSHFTE